MALNKTHTVTGSYQDALNKHLKKYENATLAVDGKNLDAHFEGTSMAFGYGLLHKF